jgi:hypothetical protein
MPLKTALILKNTSMLSETCRWFGIRLIWVAFGAAGFMVWCVVSFFINRGKRDWPTARIVRKIPLIGGYMRDLSFADSMAAASRMLRTASRLMMFYVNPGKRQPRPMSAMYWDVPMSNCLAAWGLAAPLIVNRLNRSERLELATLSDLSQVATIMESIAELRSQSARTKHKLIVWMAFLLTGVYLAIGFGSAIYALTVMNMSMDSMMGGLMGGAEGQL